MYEVVLTGRSVNVNYRVPDEAAASACAQDALAAWGLRAPDALTDDTWTEQVTEAGAYAAEVAWAHITVRPV